MRRARVQQEVVLRVTQSWPRPVFLSIDIVRSSVDECRSAAEPAEGALGLQVM